ncbi:MAG: thioredoxin domain-containing protein [Candidatus Omnitrophica bacterium]|nr:thioredoxin domain-containing protein [Candidatus Omnitrophota bacterium]
MKISKPVLAGLIALMCVGAILTLKAVLFKKPFVKSPMAQLGPREKGKIGAPIQVVEYTDFQCPACSRAAKNIKEEFLKYPDKIHIELKYFPLPMHAFARRAAIYAECAAEQGKFWQFHDVLFKSQKSWSKMVSVDTYFSEMAVSLGVDGVRLSACVNGGTMEARITNDIKEGNALGVSSTPTFFVNGKMIVGGKGFKEEIEKILEKDAP